jgi:hypothetical protein
MIWCGLYLGDPLAIAWSKAYLLDCVENFVRRVMVLGPEEYEEKQCLIAQAQSLQHGVP